MFNYCDDFFGQLLEKSGLLFNSASGHSVHNRPLQVGMVAVGTYIDRY